MAKTALKINYPDFEVESVIDPEFKKDLDKITHDHLTESNTARTIRNIRKNISATIKANYGITDKEQLTKITDGLLKIHGLHEDNFDFMKNFEDGVKDTSIVDHTIDANANKNEKVMVGYLNEVLNPGKKLIGMDMLYRTMKDLYGRKEAKKLTGEMYSLSLGLSDSTSILVPYCWALDASKLVTVGRDFGVLPSKPCKRVSSYISSLCETIHQMSAHLAGAIAIGTFFLDLAHICIYKERRTLDELKNDKRFRKYVENELQQFIHSVNHLSRNGVESPFTNVSIFDSIKLKGMIGEDNYGWYFENHKAISTDNDLKDKMSNEQFQQYVIDYIMELQNLYMDFFEKGDPLNNGLPYRFPVCYPATEKFVFNNKLTCFGDAFSDFKYGWTDVRKLGFTTTLNDKTVNITNVYKSECNKFITLYSFNGKHITVTPDHKFKMVDGTFKCAKDIKIKDRIAQYNSPISYQHEKQFLDVGDYIDDLYVIGNRIKYNQHTKQIVESFPKHQQWTNSTLIYNHNESHPFDIISKCDEIDYLKKSSNLLCKTKEAKRKAAILKHIPLDYNFGRFLGLFYAEGHNCGNEIGFAFNANETEYIEFIKQYVSNVLCLKSVIRQSYNKENTSCQIVFDCKTLSVLLDKLIGRHCYYKTISSDLISNTPLAFREGLLCGIIEGDGYVNNYSCNVTTTSESGADDICYLAHTLGIRTQIKYKEAHIGEMLGNMYSFHKQFIICFNKHDILTNNYNLGKTNKFVKSNKYIQSDGFYVTDIENTIYTSPIDVYNIEVDNNEHIFTLPNGIITSNCTINLSKNEIKHDDGTVERILEDDKFLKSICKRDISRFNIFNSKGTKVCSCCRLINDTQMLDFASQVNSFGGGGSVSMGSHRVCTINFQRIALECNSVDDYYNILRTRVEEAAKILRAHKLLILKLTEQGFESFISNGYINPNRLFSTFGMLGIYEAKKTLQQRFNISDDVDITKEILVRFNQWVNEISKQYGIKGNIEQIPGETFAVRLAKADQLIYSYGDDYYKLYANQFCPLYEDFSLFEKLESDGKYNQLLTGGGIVHIQVASDTTPQQNEALIRKACSVGCEHFAINKVFSKCKKCGHVVNYKETTCHECGSEEFTYMTRVVGFFTPVDSWNKTRREWEFPRRHFTDMSVIKQS